MSKHILAVDDEKHILHLVRVNLEKAGYEVSTATNGREALEAVQTRRPDLIVMDVMMPEIDGFEVLRRLKSDPATEAIPVVMLTANGQSADVMRGWQSGAEAYLTKPFDLRELLVFVRQILDAAEESPASESSYELGVAVNDDGN